MPPMLKHEDPPEYHRSRLGEQYEFIMLLRKKQYPWRAICEVLSSHRSCSNDGKPFAHTTVMKWFQGEQERRNRTKDKETRMQKRSAPPISTRGNGRVTSGASTKQQQAQTNTGSQPVKKFNFNGDKLEMT